MGKTYNKLAKDILKVCESGTPLARHEIIEKLLSRELLNINYVITSLVDKGLLKVTLDWRLTKK